LQGPQVQSAAGQRLAVPQGSLAGAGRYDGGVDGAAVGASLDAPDARAGAGSKSALVA